MINTLTEKFLNFPYLLKMGAGTLSTRLNCSKKEIYEAKIEAREIMNSIQVTELQNIISEQEDVIAKYVGSESSYVGDELSEVRKFDAYKPLTPSEIEKLAGVDGINTYVARVWNKLQTNGIWTYSIDIRFKDKDFYNKEQLQEKLKVLMPDLTPYTLPQGSAYKQGCLNIIIADDHVGMINVTNTFDNKELTYKERLNKIIEEINYYNHPSYEEVHIISLGDQLNGWNSQTTRGGHEVKSKSNAEQFDEYVEARVDFYNKLFSSGLGESYFVHDVDNSNHSGNGFSYIANRALELYLDTKFPQVIRESITDLIGGFQYGSHVVLMGHGKDEKFQKRPMPAVLNPATDLYLYEYVDKKGYSSKKDLVTFYKGDLHQLGLQHGKFGRYINVPSLAGPSDYGDLNFGNTRAGALLEILDKESYRTITLPIWF